MARTKKTPREKSEPLIWNYDFSGTSSELIGDAGISESALTDLSARLLTAHQQVQTMRSRKVLGFLDLTSEQTRLKNMATEIRRAKECDNFVQIGSSGSLLGSKGICSALLHPGHNALSKKDRNGFPRIFFLDSPEPLQLRSLLNQIDLGKTLFHFVSKTGESADTLATLSYIYRKVEKKKGAKKAARQFIISTDPKRGTLFEISEEKGFTLLPIPTSIGARFSTLSVPGLFPASVGGIRTTRLLEGAQAMDQLCLSDDWRINPALKGAAYQYLMSTTHETLTQLLALSTASLGDIGFWYRHLWTESLCKSIDRSGNAATSGQAVAILSGPRDLIGNVQLLMEGPRSQMTTFVTFDEIQDDIGVPSTFEDQADLHIMKGCTFSTLLPQVQAIEIGMQREHRPYCTLRLPRLDEFHLGALIHLFHLQTAYIAELFNINAYDQPSAELIKGYGRALLSAKNKQRETENSHRQRIHEDSLSAV